MNGESLNLAEDLIAQLKAIAPAAFTEGKLDVETLKTLIGEETIAVGERYELNWPGKADAYKVLQRPTTETLVPNPEDSINWDETENVFIEGENLAVLKVLQKSYYGKIKMIYIDPPYNTGSDSFIYPDKFSETREEYAQRIGTKDEDGYMMKDGMFRKNSKDSGHYHSNWLNMILPRLHLARNLMTEDGVIFVSIDDNEQANLKLLMDQVFGEENFITSVIWNTEGHTDNQLEIKVNHEYLIAYRRNSSFNVLSNVVDPNTNEDSNLWKGFAENSITKNGKGNPPSTVTLPKGFPCKIQSLNLPQDEIPEKFVEEVKELGYISRKITKKHDVTYPIRIDPMIVEDGYLSESCRVYTGWANVNKLKKFIDNDCKPFIDGGDEISFYLSKNGVVYYYKKREEAKNILSVLRNFSTTEKMRSELESYGIDFDYPKPYQLIQYLVEIGSKSDDVVLDFFSGSGTLAHAVLNLNKEDGGRRKFICVQLPEKTDEKSEAFKAGYETISAIAEARIKKVIEKLASEREGKLALEDQQVLGFRKFTLQDSNFKLWRGDIKDVDVLKQQMQLFVTPEREGALTENILWELLVKNGKLLTEQLLKYEVEEGVLWSIQDGSIAFALDVWNDSVRDKLLKLQPQKVIALDSVFDDNDAKKSNAQLQCEDAGISFTTV